jgi:hypothetical protein
MRYTSKKTHDEVYAYKILGVNITGELDPEKLLTTAILTLEDAPDWWGHVLQGVPQVGSYIVWSF